MSSSSSNYTDRAEEMGTSNDYHPWGNLLVAEGFLAQVHDALKNSPQWDRMVFVLNLSTSTADFSITCRRRSARTITKLAGSGPHPDLKRLGFRFRPLPWALSRRAGSRRLGPYEHCSVLK